MAAIYQWFPPEIGPGDFLDYDYFVANTDNGDQCKLIGADFTTGGYEEFGSFKAGFYQGYLATDRTVFFMPSISPTIRMYSWRGNCFSFVHAGSVGGNNAGADIIQIISKPNHVITAGQNSFGHGIRVATYTIDPPDFPTNYGLTPSLDYWCGFADLRWGNKNTRETGDALLCLPQNGNNLTTYKIVDGSFVLVDQQSASSLGNYMSWGGDRDLGLFVTHSNAGTFVNAYQVDMNDLTISSVGQLTSTAFGSIRAATISPTGYLFTFEEDGLGARVATYSISGLVLTLEDSLVMPSDTNSNAKFETSPRTGRVWLLNPSSSNGLRAFQIGEDGSIDQQWLRTGLTFYNAGAEGHKISFLYDPPIVTGNGFSGIKAKVYEAWDMDEIGSVTRVGEMGIADLSVNLGTVNSVVNALGTAAHFTDSTAALILAETEEIEGTGAFSICIDCVIDDKTGNGEPEMTIVGMHNFDAIANYIGVSWGLRYHVGNDRFEAYIGGSTFLQLIVPATDVGPITEGQKYHLYLEYSTLNDTLSIRVNGGTKYSGAFTAVLPTPTSYLEVGRLGSASSFARPLLGATNRLFYFWDNLSDEEQIWMWNSGATRAFSEL